VKRDFAQIARMRRVVGLIDGTHVEIQRPFHSIFKTSTIGKKFSAGECGHGVLLGDSGYANTTYLFTPYSEPRNPIEERFNKLHKTTRCMVERSFGILKK
ncbi:putative Protein F57G4.9, partial [Daphnia magna]